jgi:hypothetical protein
MFIFIAVFKTTLTDDENHHDYYESSLKMPKPNKTDMNIICIFMSVYCSVIYTRKKNEKRLKYKNPCSR